MMKNIKKTKKFFSVFLVVFLSFMLSVPALAVAPSGDYYQVRGGNTYLGLIDTANATPAVKDFLKRWVSSDSNILAVPRSSTGLFQFILVSNVDVVIFDFASKFPPAVYVPYINITPSLSCESVELLWDTTKRMIVPNSSVKKSKITRLDILVGGTFFNKVRTSLRFLLESSVLSYQGQFFLEDNSGIVDGYNVSGLGNSEHLLSIKYQYEDGTTASATHNEALVSGAAYNVQSPSVSGFSPSQTVLTGTMPDHDLSLTVTYSPIPYTLTVNYVYRDGSTAFPAHTEEVVTGAAYSVASPVNPGYTPDRVTVTGVMPGQSHSETVTYLSSLHILTINYVYQGGLPAAPSHTESLAAGVSYSVASPQISGYTPDAPVLAGVMPANDYSVLVTYAPVTTPVEPVEPPEPPKPPYEVEDPFHPGVVPDFDDPFRPGTVPDFDDPFRPGVVPDFDDPFRPGTVPNYEDPFQIGKPPVSSDPFQTGEVPDFDDPFRLQYDLFNGTIKKTAAHSPTDDYIGFSPQYISVAGNNLRSNIGNIFSVAIYAFLIVTSVYVLISIISSIGR